MVRMVVQDMLVLMGSYILNSKTSNLLGVAIEGQSIDVYEVWVEIFS